MIFNWCNKSWSKDQRRYNKTQWDQIEFGLGINFHAPANPRSVFLTNAVCVSAKVDKLHWELHRGITGAWSWKAGQTERSRRLIRLDRRDVKQDGAGPGTMSLSDLSNGSDSLPRHTLISLLTTVGLWGNSGERQKTSQTLVSSIIYWKVMPSYATNLSNQELQAKITR